MLLGIIKSFSFSFSLFLLKRKGKLREECQLLTGRDPNQTNTIHGSEKKMITVAHILYATLAFI